MSKFTSRLCFAVAFLLFHLSVFGQTDTLRVSYRRDYEARKYASSYAKAQQLWALTPLSTAEYASVLHDLGRISRALKSDSADFFFTQALELKDKLLGKNSDSYLNTLRELANFYRIDGKKPKESDRLMAQMLHYANNSGSLWTRYFAYENTANVYYNRGVFQNAVNQFDILLQVDDSIALTNALLPNFYNQELPIRRNLDVQTRKANSQNALAACYGYLYEFDKSIEYAEPAVDVFRKINSPNLLGALNNLGGSYDNLGQYEKAIKLYLEAFDLLKKQSKPDSNYIAIVANNIGYCYERQSLIHKAIPYYEQSLAIRRTLPPSSNTDELISKGCYKLGNAYSLDGQIDKSLPLLQASLALKNSSKQAQEHPDYGVALQFLGDYFYRIEALDSAVFYYEKFYAHSQARLKNTHEQNLYACLATGSAWAKKQTFTQANERLNRYNALQFDKIQHTFSFLSESERELYVNKFTKEFNEIQSLSSKNANDELSAFLFHNTLIYKGLLLEENQSWQQDFAKTKDKNTAEAYKNWKKQQLKLDASAPAERDSLEGIVKLLEKQLNKGRSRLNDDAKLMDWRAIQKTLGDEEAAVEFVHFNVVNAKGGTDSVFYAAYIIRKGFEAPKYVPLFEEKTLEKALNANPSAHDIAALYRGKRGIEPVNNTSTQGAITDLFKLIWSPIEPFLGEVKKIWYAPTGLLNRVSFDAIPLSITGKKDDNLSDKYALNYISSSKLLVSKATQNSTVILSDAVLFGNINYDSVGTLQTRKSRNENFFAALGLRPFLKRAGGNVYWQTLKGTQQEMSIINDILKKQRIATTIFEKQAASEESFKAFSEGLPSPSIIHIATHGYFFAKEKTVQNDSTANQFTSSENPLIRSGLILAGANRAWQGDAKPNQEDGILTANEIRRLNLSKTQLAVLSACETGLGDIHGSEGVFGLQRAFKQAGVRYLLVSLWKIPDQQTAILMGDFYQNLSAEKDVRKAFRAAQKSMRNRYKNQPFYWAGFVLIE